MAGGSALRSVGRAPLVTFRAVGRGIRVAVVRGRWLVVALWLAGAVLAFLNPAPGDGGGDTGIGSLVPADSEAVAVQERSSDYFRVPLLSDTAVVIHDPDGLDPLTQADITLWALAHTQAYIEGAVPPGTGHIIGAIPLPTGDPDTYITYLYISPDTGLAESVALARQYANHFDNQEGIETFVTGVLPSQVQQVTHLESRLHVFEIATLILVTLVVAATFRSVVAPLVVLFTAGLGYFVAVQALDRLATMFEFALPEELRPLVAALLIGVVTDYCVLFFSGFRRQLARGLHRHAAARATLLSEGPIVAVAGTTVAAGTAALLVANFQLFRAFGPALSLTVVVGVLVSLTLVPALMAILGSRLFVTFGGAGSGSTLEREPSRFTRWMARTVSTKRGAALGLLAGLALLVPASLPLVDLRIDASFSSELPQEDPVRLGANVLAESGVRGIVAPTEVLVEGEDVAEQRAALVRFQELLAEQPGVADVIGPAENPLAGQRFGVVLAEDGDAARFAVILDSDPLAAPAITDVGRLQERVDELLAEAGVEGATVGIGGQTAIAAELAQLTRENLWRILVAALIVELVILAFYLRAFLAPLLLLASSALGVAAALGLAVLFFQGLFDNPGLIFFTPFATAVLLLALGSDYNVFAVGSIWEEATRRPLSRAIAVAMPATARAIGAAGLILASTFAMVAIIPLGLFRQIAFIMAVGLLIDTFVIRPVFTPAILTLLGPLAGWPNRRIQTGGSPLTAREQRAMMAEPDPADRPVPDGAGARRPGPDGAPGEPPVPPDRDVATAGTPR